MANINQQGQFNPYPYGGASQVQNYGPQFSPQPQPQQLQPQPMVQQYFIPQPQPQVQPSTYMPQSGISMIPVNSDDQVINHPVVTGNTVLFVNFNTNRMCFKTANTNGTPFSYRWATIIYDDQENQAQQQTQNVQQNQNDVNVGASSNGVSREEFEELKSMLAVALSNNQQNNGVNNEPRQNSRYNGKRGNRNDESRAVPANNE